jgi:hypothetical protein
MARTLTAPGTVHPLRFGRRHWPESATARAPVAGWSDDVRLFAGTFAAGFIVVSVLIA